jgi:multidrug efflux pump subunit AcrB
VNGTTDRQTAGEAIGGLLAAAALFLGFMAMAYRPARLVPFAALLVLAATAMSGRRHQRLVLGAVVVVGLGWLVGMAIAVITNNPIY